MQVLIKQYGMTLVYGIVAAICVVLVFSFAGKLLGESKYLTKNVVYNSNSYDKESVPKITCTASIVEIEKNIDGYSSADEVLESLYSNNIISVDNYNTISLSGKVNTKKEGTYNVKIIATNEAGKTAKNIAIIVSDSSHLY